MTRDGVAYIKALLGADRASASYEIGWQVWMMPGRDQILEYLTTVMTANRAGTRAFEIAYEIWLLMGERGVAA